GAVSSQSVTEEFQGTLNPVGNRVLSVKVEGCLTASPISRAGPKGGLSDPAVLDGKAVAQQIKGTPGITGLSPLSVHSGGEGWHLYTTGGCGRKSVPKKRLITANPDLVCEPSIANCEFQNAKCKLTGSQAVTPWEVVFQFAL